MSLSTGRILPVLTALCLLAPAVPASAATTGHAGPGSWSTAWSAAHHHPVPGNEWDGPNWSVPGFADQSVRQVVRVSAAGSLIRIRLSNRYGGQPLRLTGATIGRPTSGAEVRPGTLRPVTFDLRRSTTVPVGAETTSDPVLLPVRALEAVTVTLYFAGPAAPATFHQDGLTNTYRAEGDHRFDHRAAAFAGETSQSWYHLAGVDVAGSPRTGGTVVTFGDSQTDGYGSTPGANNRYPDQLAERLVATGRPLAVANAGIGGNKLLADSPCYGERGVTRFRRDALGLAGVRVAVVLMGINDIGGGGWPDFGCGASPVVTAGQLIDGHRALIRAARAQGVTIIGVTMPPMKHADNYDTPANERVRDEVNRWIRTGGEYDAVVDLDRVLADPADPDALRPAYDEGDHLHLNDTGATAAAAAVAAQIR
ncbi:SGNH/GDSL hydrolase family protein [Micromonospora sp. STR1_7]|uniref:SGNH/GDSL hydrolase family protein n=1 Tax=Micromonospora parastrephiae TaxID=2806101 RepID=A0ABS1XQ33_9ACTN|nr:SGNH/GDSL hydrolase family protein [Micromonospora parastrephiae]MBM0231374.1 SGNH/GDSL hydrolase family protein [Micromonospora parastrephiae]